MEPYRIDINCDVGEGVANEDLLFPFISSCNIACGGHAGDKTTMTKTVKLANENSVAIGAHPSYPDFENFGRRSMDLGADELSNSITWQFNSLYEVCMNESVHIKHIKPHGALYNDLAKKEYLADLFLEIIQDYRSKLVLFVPFGSVIEKIATQKGFQVKVEAFADRNYNEDLSLVSRTQPNALLHDPKEVLDHLMRLVKEQKVRTVTSTYEILKADTYCVHGDTPNALQILTYLTKELPKHNIVLQK